MSEHDEAMANHLATALDPSLTAPAATRSPQAARRLAWVRPTELASYASPLVGRGIDLHAELIRRARSAPLATTRTAQRAIAPTRHQTIPDQKGIQL